MPRDREKEKEKKRLRYATDPAYRERILENVRRQSANRKRVHKPPAKIIDVKRRQCESCGRLFVSQHYRDVVCGRCGESQ